MGKQIFAVPVLFLFFSCSNQIKHRLGTGDISRDEMAQTNSPEIRTSAEEIKTDEFVPVSGYRFLIEGDFDGDGKNERLTECYYSGLDRKETNKFYQDLPDYEQLVILTMQKKPYTFIVSDNPLIDTLHITSKEQQFGLSYLKNEGDLNGDGTDEISYVVNWADWSSCNTWYIMTYRNSKWEEFYSFPIWDWMLPDLPETISQYGLMGLNDKTIGSNDTVNEYAEEILADFEGLVRKMNGNKIRVIYRNEEAELDSVIIDLNDNKVTVEPK
ncbi:MAG: hypothetical protein LBV74_05205 [Tannerella sp.]|jgi:hypothetical protein|nr:hypothetical protein [Tannerella sp.]